MADNTQLSTNIGSGDIIASDDIGSVKFPRGKLTLGADGVNDGDVSAANPLPVTAPTALPTTNSVLAAAIGTPGSTLPVSAVQAGGTDGAVFRTLRVNQDGTQVIAPSPEMLTLLSQMVAELRAIRLAMTSLVTESGHAWSEDFSPAIARDDEFFQ
jgi:hypothetical protein